MKPNIVVQAVSKEPGIPSKKTLQAWASLTLEDNDSAVEITIRLVDDAEMLALNQTYRGKSYATNVLSFPYDEDLLASEYQLLGDIVICAPVIAREAVEQNKSLESHFAHMIIHGILHLLGYDHEQPEEAEQMEQLEIALLARLGFNNPYRT